MSNWTHVAGIIRVDDFGRCLGEKPLNLEKIIEPLPYGSEGPLEMTVWENPKKYCVFSYVVSIFGDLRDHHSAEEIVEWFKKICAKLAVRDAVITAQNEWNGTAIWVYEESD